MLESDTIWDELKELRGATDAFGVVHPNQVYQLRCWGGWLMANAPSVDIIVRLPESEEGEAVVGDYGVEISAKEFTAPADFKQKAAVVDKWVKTLLGNRFGFSVKVGKKTIFNKKGRLPKKRDVKETLERLQNGGTSK